MVVSTQPTDANTKLPLAMPDKGDANYSKSLTLIMARLASLERDSSRYKDLVASSERAMSQSTSSSGNDDDDDDDSPQSNCTDTTLPSVEGKHSAHAIYELIKTIHRAVGTGEEETTNSDLLEDSGQQGAALPIHV